MPAGDDKKPKGSYLFDQKISDSKEQPSLYIQYVVGNARRRKPVVT